jgi:hypothetical protein
MGSMIQRRSDDAFFKPKKVHPKRSAGGFPIGPRTKARQEGNRDMNKEFREQGYPRTCELRYDGICAGAKYLHWAHWDKARFLLTKKDWRIAALACDPCHDHAEIKPRPQMKADILAAIARRKPNG